MGVVEREREWGIYYPGTYRERWVETWEGDGCVWGRGEGGWRGYTSPPPPVTTPAPWLSYCILAAMVIVLQSTTTVPAIAIFLRHAVYYYLIIKNNKYETPGPISLNVLGPFLLRGYRTAFSVSSVLPVEHARRLVWTTPIHLPVGH